ncbi:MAG: S4 domain-containing protein [Dokdonella sp.]
MIADQSAVRLDLWLWAARFFKTRSLAKEAIERGRVEIDGIAVKPATLVHVGERLTIRRGDERVELEITALSNRRGSAVVAQTLYRETEASRSEREAQREARRLSSTHLEHPQKRPDKQARRALIDWKEGSR